MKEKHSGRAPARYGKNATQDRRQSYSNREKNERPEIEQNENMISGRNAVKELLSSGRDIDKIFVASGDRNGSISVLVAEAIERKIPVIETDRKKLDSMLGASYHQGIIAMAAERNYATVDDIIAYAESKGEKPLIAICDGLEDPHNLGALIRCAECSGVHGVIIPKRRNVGLTSVVAKSSAGAIEHMLVAKVTNLAQTIEELKQKGIWVYASDMNGTSYFDLDFTSPSAIVFGSEGSGISRLVSERSDFVVSIPMYGQVNSMNVSTAASVILCEAARQRHK
jgi:23S rRNA (guanosine2251-2'-O)-methyltransferase